jgi:hypothetical protein
MEPVVGRLLTNTGYRIIRTSNGPTDLPAPNVDQLRQLGAVDTEFLDTVRHHDRALVGYEPAMVQPALLIGQVARAYPKLTVAVGVSRITEARGLRDQLRRYLPDVVAVTGDYMPPAIGRVVVGTYSALGAGAVELEHRDLVFALDAQEALGDRGLQCFSHACKARLFGFLAKDSTLSAYEGDMLRGLFGFRQMYVPRHNHHERRAEVTFYKVAGANLSRTQLDAAMLKREGIWTHELRNRRIARLAHQMTDGGGIAEGQQPMPGGVAVLVENVEHAVALARYLPSWPVITARTVCNRGLSLRQHGHLGVRGNPSNGAIITSRALQSVELDDIGVLIRADAGTGLTPLMDSQLVVSNAHPLPPLLVIDFNDRHHPELRRRTRCRRQGYAGRGWFAPGADPVEKRIEQFLAARVVDQPGGASAAANSSFNVTGDNYASQLEEAVR